jgi:hypothetical protein
MQPFIGFTNCKFSIDFGYYADQLGLYAGSDYAHSAQHTHVYRWQDYIKVPVRCDDSPGTW